MIVPTEFFEFKSKEGNFSLSEYIEWKDYIATEENSENWENFTFTLSEEVELKEIGFVPWFRYNKLKNLRGGGLSWEDDVADYSVLLFWKRFWRYLINSISDNDRFLKECHFLPINVDLDKFDV